MTAYGYACVSSVGQTLVTHAEAAQAVRRHDGNGEHGHNCLVWLISVIPRHETMRWRVPPPSQARQAGGPSHHLLIQRLEAVTVMTKKAIQRPPLA
jgi:hypothetical protein